MLKKDFVSISLLTILLLLNYQNFAQRYCLTPQESSNQKFRYRSNVSKNKLNNETYFLKIYVHVIRYSDGTGGFNRTDVEEILSYLDTSFNPYRINFTWDNEIDFIDDDLRYYYGPGNYYSSTDIFSVNNNYDGIDIYLYPESAIASGGRANGVGESSEFWVSGTMQDQVTAKSYVTAHEMGHVLNLWHTHHGCETGGIWEFTDGSNCSVAGDFICDTPADPDMDFGVNPETCEWQNFPYCTPLESVSSYTPDTKNIMSYSSLNCYEYFSKQQGERFKEAIATLPYLQATITNVQTAGCNADDWNALKQLYISTNGDNWINNTNWELLKQDSIPEDCSFRGLHGITFDNTERVTTINLYKNNLVGTIPDEIGDLSNLIYLDLGFNSLSDSLNTEIGNLTALEVLFLDNNQFVGGIPFSFSKLEKLAQLKLQNNFLGGCYYQQFAKWCELFSLGNVTISEGNNFDATFEDFCETFNGVCLIEKCHINDWLALKQFYNSTNGDSWIDNLNWDIVKNEYTPIDCDLRKLRGVNLNTAGRVMVLDLYENNLSGHIPNQINNLTELLHLDLGYNSITDTIPSAISELTKLNSLYLDNNKLNGIIPATLGNMTNLFELYLNNNNLAGCPDTNLSKLCTQLNDDSSKNENISDGNSLYIEWEDFCKFGVDSCELSPCAIDWYALKQLYFSTNGDSWYNNNGWEIVKNDTPPLYDCNFNALYGVRTNNAGRVIEIDLTSNNLNGNIPPEINDITSLEILDLCVNNLSDTIPNFSNLINLTLIDLHDNSLIGNISPEIGNLINLTLIDLHGNSLTGNIPPEIGNLTNVVEINFEENSLTGNIPPELGQLSNLFYLFLSNNLLTGSIPGELSNITNLYSLLLTNNELSGCHDERLQNFCSISVDVDYGNNFEANWADFCFNGDGICIAATTAKCNNIDVLSLFGARSEESSFHSAIKISSTATIKATTVYKAGDTIELNVGFEADGLNNFIVEIEACE